MCDENKDSGTMCPCPRLLNYGVFFFSNSPASEWLFSSFGILSRGIQHSSFSCIYVRSILSTWLSYAVSNILLPQHLTVQRLESLFWTKWTQIQNGTRLEVNKLDRSWVLTFHAGPQNAQWWCILMLIAFHVPNLSKPTLRLTASPLLQLDCKWIHKFDFEKKLFYGGESPASKSKVFWTVQILKILLKSRLLIVETDR